MAFMAVILGLGPLFTNFEGLGRVLRVGFRVKGFMVQVVGLPRYDNGLYTVSLDQCRP